MPRYAQCARACRRASEDKKDFGEASSARAHAGARLRSEKLSFWRHKPPRRWHIETICRTAATSLTPGSDCKMHS